MVDHEHTEPTEPTEPTPTDGQPTDGQTPARDWTDEKYPLVDADFVGDTLDRILDDRKEIDVEASLVEEIHFDQQALNAYSIPEPTANFVASALAQVNEQRAAGIHIRDENEERFDDLLRATDVPPCNPHLVDRCLKAVMADRTARIDRERASRRVTLLVSAAAIVLCAVTIYWMRGDTSSTDALPEVTPVVAWAALPRSVDQESSSTFDSLDALDEAADSPWPDEDR